MRELPWDGEVDAVVNLFTALGSFAAEEDDARVLAAVARPLRARGALLLDTIDRFLLARGFQERSWSELHDGRLLIEARAYDHLAGRSTAVRTLLARDRSRREHRHSLRASTLPELAALLAGAGLDVVEAWGGWDGQPYGFEGTRLVVHARTGG